MIRLLPSLCAFVVARVFFTSSDQLTVERAEALRASATVGTGATANRWMVVPCQCVIKCVVGVTCLTTYLPPPPFPFAHAVILLDGGTLGGDVTAALGDAMRVVSLASLMAPVADGFEAHPAEPDDIFTVRLRWLVGWFCFPPAIAFSQLWLIT